MAFNPDEFIKQDFNPDTFLANDFNPDAFISGSLVDKIPGIGPELTNIPQEPSLLNQAMGLAAGGLSTATGVTTGGLGLLAGTVEGIAEDIAAGRFGTPKAKAEETAMEADFASTNPLMDFSFLSTASLIAFSFGLFNVGERLYGNPICFYC